MLDAKVGADFTSTNFDTVFIPKASKRDVWDTRGSPNLTLGGWPGRLLAGRAAGRADDDDDEDDDEDDEDDAVAFPLCS